MKRSKWGIYLFLFLLGVAIAGWVMSMLSNVQRRQGYLWHPQYEHSSSQPYGLAALYQMLRQANTPHDVIVLRKGIGELTGQQESAGVYMYIGHDFPSDSATLEKLLDFVAQGNDAFISSASFSYMCLAILTRDTCKWLDDYELHFEEDTNSVSVEDSPFQIPEEIWAMYMFDDSVVVLSLANSPHEARIRCLFKNRPFSCTWEYIQGELLCPGIEILGTIDTHYVNFIRFDYGNGRLFLHNTPLAFTNLPLLDSTNYRYVESIIGQLRPGDIYFDTHEYSLTPLSDEDDYDTPLAYILSQSSLAIAWYILLGLGLIFLFFDTKRRQRIIPELATYPNTSLEFIQHIGRLYFLKKDYRELASLKMNLWEHFVRERYRINLQEPNERAITTLSMRTTLPEEHIRKILTLRKNLHSSRFLSKNTLIDIHHALEEFYQKSHFNP